MFEKSGKFNCKYTFLEKAKIIKEKFENIQGSKTLSYTIEDEVVSTRAQDLLNLMQETIKIEDITKNNEIFLQSNSF
mgnify:CR=1 FL=1